MKVANFLAAHLLGSSKSNGILSPHYYAPEQMPPTSARSSLPTDVYSLGKSLIEIFTGSVPFPDDRLNLIVNRHRLYEICSRMISGEERVGDRPTSAECLDVLTREIKYVDFPRAKRMAEGKFVGSGENRRHVVVLSDIYHTAGIHEFL